MKRIIVLIALALALVSSPAKAMVLGAEFYRLCSSMKLNEFLVCHFYISAYLDTIKVEWMRAADVFVMPFCLPEDISVEQVRVSFLEWMEPYRGSQFYEFDEPREPAAVRAARGVSGKRCRPDLSRLLEPV